jgi:hypothetical protein
MKKRYSISLFFGILILGTAFFASISQAQISLSLYPTSIRLSLDPGETWSGSITVINPNTFDLKVNPEKENLGGGAEGAVELLGENISYGLASWIHYNEGQISLKAEERREIPITISVPQNAQPGGHYAAVLFRGLTSSEAQGSGVGISGRVGSIVLVEVSGETSKSGTIEEVIAPKFISHGPLEVGFKIKNTGNTHFSPEGKIIISGLLQDKELTWEPRVVFPGYDRTFKASWTDKYLFGPLTVEIMAQIPGGESLVIDSFTVWAFPWQEVLILIVGITILVLLLKFFKKRFKIVKV